VKLYSRPGNDLTYRFPLIVAAAFLAGGDGDGNCFLLTPQQRAA
jgi:ATP-dependent DNA ligase